MKATLKTIFITLLVIVLMVSLTVPCVADDKHGTITVKLEDKEKNKIDGTTVYICQIASLNAVGYYPTAAFETSGISISGIINNPDATVAQAITEYAVENNVETVSQMSEKGEAAFTDLPLGIWLVYCDESSKYTFNPYIVFLPFESGGKAYYEVTSTPKVEDSKPDEMNVYVFKKWDDKDNAAKKRPDSITVELLNGNTVMASAELNETNGWSYMFLGVKKDGAYSVREKSVIDYKASYGGDAINGFVITNTYAGEKLPDTGQHWWPLVVIAIAGVCFVLLGIFEIGVKKNGKKK